MCFNIFYFFVRMFLNFLRYRFNAYKPFKKDGKYPEFRKNPRTPKEMTNEICIEFKTVIFH